jgi:hypothetical protein
MKNEIDKDLEELEHLTARISENRKLLKLAEARALAKTVCLLDEMEIEEEQERIKNGGLSDGEMREVALERLTLQDAEGSSLVDWSVLSSSWVSLSTGVSGSAFSRRDTWNTGYILMRLGSWSS